MFEFTVRVLEHAKASLIEEHKRIIDSCDRYDPQDLNKNDPNINGAIERVCERIAEVDMAQTQLEAFSKMMDNPYISE